MARGLMGAAPVGCRVTVAHFTASCPTAGAELIEVDMGPSGDEVDVLRRLSLPLTVHLGAGSDKFVGNGERDTCYSEGARRNRCIGGGRDICITGNRNSDCVGGPGDDHLYGGPGYDYCDGGRESAARMNARLGRATESLPTATSCTTWCARRRTRRGVAGLK